MASESLSQERIDKVRATVRVDGGDIVRIETGAIVQLKRDGKYNIAGKKYSPRQISEIFPPEDLQPAAVSEISPPEESVDEQPVEVSNAEFLTSIFGELPDDAYVAFCGFPGDPKERKSWPHELWAGDEIAGGRNTYFSIAAIKADADGKIARKKANYAGLYCVMLDDIGTKVTGDLRVDPSWVLETSPGNHQVGYIFESPVAYAEADSLMKALKSASMITDTGGQNVVRWARLPVGLNGKGTLDAPFTSSQRDLHPQVCAHAGRTNKKPGIGWHRPGLQSSIARTITKMTETLYAQNRELGFALTLIKHMSEHNLLIAERAIREARSKLTQRKQIEEFDHRRRVGTM